MKAFSSHSCFDVFNKRILVDNFKKETGIKINSENEYALNAAIKWHLYKQTSLSKRAVVIPSLFVISLLGTLTTFYYYTLCSDKSWKHLIEMVAPAFLSLLLGILGTLGCIRGYAYAEYQLAKSKLD